MIRTISGTYGRVASILGHESYESNIIIIRAASCIQDKIMLSTSLIACRDKDIVGRLECLKVSDKEYILCREIEAILPDD
jgi:hypothetical protein